MDECSNELMEAAEDEEGIDQMNDLTFGGNDICKFSLLFVIWYPNKLFYSVVCYNINILPY